MKSLKGYVSLKMATTLCVAFAIQGCGNRAAKDSVRSADERAVLAQSSFNTGEVADDPLLMSTLGDGGFIPGGPGNGGGGDGGTIPVPPTNPPVEPPTGPVVENPPAPPTTEPPVVPPVIPPTEPPQGPVVENPPVPPTTPTEPTEPTMPPVAENPPTTPGGNDGGTIPDPGGPGGGPDGGTIPPVVENPPTEPPVTPPVIPPTEPPQGPVVENPPVVPPTEPPPVIPPVVPPTEPPQGPVVENPPVTPPVIPPPGEDGGNVPGNPPGNPPGDGGAICAGCIDVTIDRVCSERRSKIPFPQFVFFEEARDPRLTLETRVTVPSSKPSASTLAGIGGGQQLHPVESQLLNILINALPKSKKDVAMGNKDLADVDLMQGRYTTKLAVAMQVIRAWFPNSWRDIYLEAHVCDDRDRDGLCADEKDSNQLLAKETGFKLKHMPSKLKLLVWNGRSKTLKGNPDLCEEQYSPLVLDLNGDGLRFSAPENGVLFDLNDTGDQLLTGWTVGRDDAFLVRDIDGNGHIDSGAELFGSATKLENGNRADNGFLALADLDTNANRQFDPGDETWADVMLWIDRNRDGISEKAEMLSLDRAGVQSISLNYVDVRELDRHGNETRQRAVFRRAVGGKTVLRQVIDIWFATLSIAE